MADSHRAAGSQTPPSQLLVHTVTAFVLNINLLPSYLRFFQQVMITWDMFAHTFVGVDLSTNKILKLSI
jgi:hypothetical protein